MFDDHQIHQYLTAARLCLRITIVGAATLAVALAGSFLMS
jgi:hypothetical protein